MKLKGPHRYGTFRDVIRNNVVFVFGTGGDADENAWSFNKARFDAERFWYQGNGSVEVLADTECAAPVAGKRNVLLYGNASTNRLWKILLGDSPVQVRTSGIEVGGKRFTGGNLSCVFVRPGKESGSGTIGVVAGTGIIGMRATNKMPYLLPGIGFPDLLITRSSTLTRGEDGLVGTGLFGDDWSVEEGEFEWGNE